MRTPPASLLLLCMAATTLVANAMSYQGTIPQLIQKPEQRDLFVNIDKTKIVLTSQQQAALMQLQSDQATTATRLVRVRTDLLGPAKFGVRMNLGNEFQIEQIETRPKEDSMTWIGKRLGPLDSAIFIVKGDNVTGTILVGDETYAIRPLGAGLHAVLLQDEKKLPPDHPPEFNEIQKKPSEPFETSLADLPESPLVLRILVAYTPRVAAKVLDLGSLIELAISETNLGYEQSRVRIRAELAATIQVDYTESGSFPTDLKNLETRNDGIMDEVHQRRDTSKADVCVLLIDNDSYGGLSPAILVNESRAFAAVHWGHATAKKYSFAHEIGHLQGARHNVEADSANTPFSYGHGYLNPLGKWRTIMANDCPQGCTRLRQWSNPFVFKEGLAMGRDDCCYDARVLNETAPIITSFRN